MRSGILITLVVAILCACATAQGQPEQFSPGDIVIVLAGEPNDPNGVVPPTGENPAKTWDPATHLVADWESISVSMTSRLYNSAMQPNTAVEGPQWSMSLAGIIGIVDSNGLIGLTRSPSSLVALDQDGKVVSRSMAGNSPTERYQRPISLIAPGAKPGAIPVSRVTLNLPLDPNAAFPEMFSRIEWTMNVLVAPELKTVDVPFEASDAWLELTPGMEILVEQATVEQGKYEYRIHLRYDSKKVEYMVGGSIYLWRFGVTGAAVLQMDVLDSEGKPISNVGGNWSFRSPGSLAGSGNQTTATATGSGTCNACATAAIIRYTLGLGIHAKEVSLALENIPVPEF